MNPFRAIFAIAALGALAACSTPTDLVTRTISPTGPLLQVGDPAPSQGVPTLVRPSYTVSQVNVVVPDILKVSEANTYKPVADIVWRGDPLGNRYEQIAAIFRDAIGTGVAGLDGEHAVIVDIQVTRFHALTERTRYSIGGTHDIRFALTIRDAETGAVIEPTRLVETELTAYGGRAAIRAEAAGQTQKVRISTHLAQLIRQELTAPREMLVADAG